MRALSSVIVLSIGFLAYSGSPARAQLGAMGEAAKRGAADAVKQEVMKGAAEQAGVPVAGTPTGAPAAAGAAAPAAAGAAAPAAAGAAAPAAEAAAPAAAGAAAPAAAGAAAPAADVGGASAPAGTPAAAAPAAADTPAPTGAAGETMMDKARQKAMEEGSKKMMPKLP